VLAISLMEDIEKDVAFLTSAIAFSEQKIAYCDSILWITSSPVTQWDTSRFYKNINVVSQSNPFFPTTGTYKQIVTSGSLKLFDQSIANQLNAYDMQLKKIAYWSEVEDESLWLMADILWTGINLRALGDIRFSEQTQKRQFIKIEQSSVEKFVNLVSAVKIYRKKTLFEYQEQHQLAIELLESLKTMYHLEG